MLALLALRLGFPPGILHNCLLFYFGALVLAAEDCYSKPIPIDIGIPANCNMANHFGRIYVYDILERAHRFLPRAQFRQYVDDMPQREQEKQEKDLASFFPRAAVSFACSLQQRTLKLSKKSEVFTNSVATRDALVEALKGQGVVIKVAASARDLGYDATNGSKRALSTPHGREKAATLRIRPLRQIAAAGRPAKKLANAAVKPKLAYHAPLCGLAPSTLQRFRSKLADATKAKKPGYCTTTAFALQAGKNPAGKSGDPAVTCRQAQAKEWIRFWGQATVAQKLAVGKVWKAALENATCSGEGHRWKAAIGPISAMVLSLLDAGWYPNSPAVWTDPALIIWVNEGKPGDLRDCLQKLGRDALAKQWATASEQYNGARLQDGAFTSGLAVRLLEWRKKGKPELAASLASIATNFVWTHQRQRLAGIVPAGACLFCGQSDPTDVHRYWECPALSSSEDPLIARSQHLVRPAAASCETEACFWIRGLMPKHWLPGTDGARHGEELRFNVEEATVQGVSPWSCQHLAEKGILLYTDGSGGTFASDSRLRRCAWSVVALKKRGPHLRRTGAFRMGTPCGLGCPFSRKQTEC